MNLKTIFIKILKIFNEEEYQQFIKNNEITIKNDESTKKIYIYIDFLEKPSSELLFKLFFFKSSEIVIKFPHNYFLYNSASLFELIVNFLKFENVFVNKFDINEKFEKFQFCFPIISFIAHSVGEKIIYQQIFQLIKKFIIFLFSDLTVYLEIKNQIYRKQEYLGSKYFVFKKEEVINFFKNEKQFAIGITNFKTEYLLLATNANKPLIENIENLKVNEWYNFSFNLETASPKRLKHYDGWLNSFQKTETPSEYLRDDKLDKKISCLCVHSKFSSFDGLFSFSDTATIAKKFNHTSLAITDFFSVQSFSDVEKVSKELKIKPLYGCEMELFNDDIPIIVNLKNYKKDAKLNTYCFFDIETTGFYGLFDQIIEVAIIKYKNQIEIDNYHAYIKCPNPLKKEIIELTKITDEILSQKGKNIKTVLKEIKIFIGNSILVAHNGIEFDLPFLNAQYIKNNLPIINNPLIDTVRISKTLYFESKFKSHALKAIAKRFSISFDDEQLHGAKYDTDILIKIWQTFSHELNIKNDTWESNLDELDIILNNNGIKQNHVGENIMIYAKNQEGIKIIYELISKAHIENFYLKPIILKSDIEKNKKNIIVVSSPLNSVFLNSVLKYDFDAFKKNEQIYDYLLLPPTDNFLHKISKNHYSMDDLKNAYKLFVKWSQEINKKIIFNWYTKYLNPWNKSQYEVLVNSKNIGGKRHYLFDYKNNQNIELPNYFFKTTQELLESYSFLNLKKTDLENYAYNFNEEIVNSISSNIEIIKKKLYSPKIEGIFEKLKTKSYKNLYKHYGKKPHEYLLNKIQHEEKIILKNNYEVVYWISHLLVEQSIKDGYLVGSRGSVGSSFVAYLLNITEVNPLPPHYYCSICSYFEIKEKFLESGFDLPEKICTKCNIICKQNGQNIPFETFVGLEGNKVPDIDLNFSKENQQTAHNFIRDFFGKTHTFRTGTINTIASKTSHALVMSYLEEKKINFNSGKISWLSSNLKDVKRTSGQHPGGILVVPKEYSIYDFTPINYPANDSSSNWLTTHFEFNDLHDTLFKFDILGHDDPRFLAHLHKLTGIDPKSISFQDKKILSLFSNIKELKIESANINGETVGTIALPEFGTILTRKILRDTPINTFADLIRISGISHGTSVWKNNIDKLVKNKKLLLNEVISCRDDIMIYLNNSGLSIKDSFFIMESARKGLGIPENYLPILKEKKIPQWYIDSANKISYIFPKSHATAYVIMSWRIAFYKLYYPLEFYATYFTLHLDFFDFETFIMNDPEIIKNKYAEINKKDFKKNKTFNIVKIKFLSNLYEAALEMMARNIKFAKIDINKSSSTNFTIVKEENAILMPFLSLGGLGQVKASEIENNRKTAGEFKDREDFDKRIKLNKTLIKHMENFNILLAKKISQQISIHNLI